MESILYQTHAGQVNLNNWIMPTIKIKYQNGVSKFQGYSRHPITESQKKTFGIDHSQQILHTLESNLKLKKGNHLVNNISVVLKPVAITLTGKTQQTVFLASKEFINNGQQTTRYDAALNVQKENGFESSWGDLGAFAHVGEVKSIVDIFLAPKNMPTTLAKVLTSYGTKQSKTTTAILGAQSGVLMDIPPKKSIFCDLTAVLLKTRFRIDYQVSLEGSISLVHEQKQFASSQSFEVNSFFMQNLGLQKTRKIYQEIEIRTYERSQLTTSSQKPKECKA